MISNFVVSHFPTGYDVSMSDLVAGTLTTSRSIWNKGIKTDPAGVMDSEKNQWMKSGKKAGVKRTLLASVKRNYAILVTTWHTVVYKRISSKEPYQERGKEETKDNVVKQHHLVDRYGLRKSTESNGQHKDDPWCGQPSDRRWLKSKSSLTTPSCGRRPAFIQEIQHGIKTREEVDRVAAGQTIGVGTGWAGEPGSPDFLFEGPNMPVAPSFLKNAAPSLS